jgi:hypothetical protein
VGRAYQRELDVLPETYCWAKRFDVRPLAESIAGLLCSPLLVVGSGGSLSAAHFAALLHQEHGGCVAKAVTPLEAVRLVPELPGTGVLIMGTWTSMISGCRRAKTASWQRILS